MRFVFYLFFISQLLSFIGVFAEKVREDSLELNSINWEKVEENKSKPFKKIIWRSYKNDESYFGNNQKQSSFPAYDIVRNSDDEYEITLAVSGFNKKDINIDVHDGVLTVKGQIMSDVQDKNVQYLYNGIAKRSFEQKFRLEQYVDVKEANLSNGLLNIVLKREIPEERKPKKIPLKVI